MLPKIIRSSEGQILMSGRQTIKLTADDTDWKMAVIISVVPAGTGVPYHIHQNEDETFEIIDGELEITLDGKTHSLKTGDMVFMPKLVPHGFKALQNTTMRVTLVPGGAEQMFVELGELPPGRPDMKNVAKIAGRY